MKKLLLFFLVAAMVIGVATMVSARIASSPHDIAAEPCAMCHTPHNAGGQYPLWNRAQADVVYTMYSSNSFDMGNANGSLATPSKLCLVCHNGNLSTLINYPGPCSSVDPSYDYDMPDGSCAQLGNGSGTGIAHDDLSNDHPISFTYIPLQDSEIDNNGFPTIDNTTFAGRAFIPGEYTGTYYKLYSNEHGTDQFECGTCHDVHDGADYPDKGTYQVYFLRHDNTGSALCMDCHVNK